MELSNTIGKIESVEDGIGYLNWDQTMINKYALKPMHYISVCLNNIGVCNYYGNIGSN